MRGIIIFILILCVLTSCKKNTKNEYTVLKQVEFDPGFFSQSMFTGSFHDSERNLELIYFSDPVSKKCIKIFDFNGKIFDSIPTANAIGNNIDDFDGISVFSKDSIFLTFSSLNKVVHMNNQGETVNKIRIDKIMADTLKYKYFFYQSYFPNVMPSSSTLIFKVWPISYDVMGKNEKIVPNITSKDHFFFSEFYKMPYFVKITDIHSNNAKTKYGPYDLNKKIYGDSNGEYNGAYFDVSTFFKYIGEDLFLMNSHSDYVYKIDGKNLTYIDRYKIKSDYTSIGVKPYIINKKVWDNSQDLDASNQPIKELINGMLENIFFNENKKEYYVFVTHSLKDFDECISFGAYGKYRPFSIIVYDENFKNPREYVFEGNLYCNRSSFVTDEGIMILKKAEKGEEYGKQVFDIISFN